MKTYVWKDYTAFSCRAGACRHTCCAGWEIDIDPETLEMYRHTGGRIGEKLRACIACSPDGEGGETASFRLVGADERCPFLTAEHLCEIYRTLGEDALCQICTDHPRYRSYLAGRCEIGLGLVCEAAAELVLSRTDKAGWILFSDDGEDEPVSPWEAELLTRRERWIACLQDRSRPLDERVGQILLEEYGTADIWFGQRAGDWQAFFRQLERMDEAWDEQLGGLTDERAVWTDGDDGVWEQLLVYFVQRHVSGAADAEEVRSRLAFALLSYAVLRTLSAGKTAAARAELCRMYSAEIEYSEENTEAVCAELDWCI